MVVLESVIKDLNRCFFCMVLQIEIYFSMTFLCSSSSQNHIHLGMLKGKVQQEERLGCSFTQVEFFLLL